MSRKTQLQEFTLSALVMLLLVSCAPRPAAPTPSPVPATPTHTPIPATATPTAVPPTGVPPTPTRTPLPPPVSPEFPTGTFYHQHAPGLFCVLVLNPDGTSAYYWYVQSLDVAGVVPYATSTYRIEGNILTELTSSYTGCNMPATYTWTFDGQNLTFQAVGEDPCPDRQRTYETPLLYRIVE